MARSTCPKRFISYPGCSHAHNPALVVAWAGWDHLQQARALAAWYTELVEQEGWVVERLTPLLVGIAELIPWLKQWHNDIDPDYHERMGISSRFFCTASSNSAVSRVQTSNTGPRPPAIAPVGGV